LGCFQFIIYCGALFHTFEIYNSNKKRGKINFTGLTVSNPIFLPPACSPALIYFGRERGWWITCNYPSFKREKHKRKEYNLRHLLAEVRTT
jgi:hypothetical protein